MFSINYMFVAWNPNLPSCRWVPLTTKIQSFVSECALFLS